MIVIQVCMGLIINYCNYCKLAYNCRYYIMLRCFENVHTYTRYNSYYNQMVDCFNTKKEVKEINNYYLCKTG